MLNISCNAFVIVFFEYKQFFQSPKRLKKKSGVALSKKIIRRGSLSQKLFPTFGVLNTAELKNRGRETEKRNLRT